MKTMLQEQTHFMLNDLSIFGVFVYAIFSLGTALFHASGMM